MPLMNGLRSTLAISGLCLAILHPPAALARPGNREAAALRTNDGHRAGRLDNGFTYQILPKPTETEINLELVVNAGFLDEDPDQLHVAHLVEHVVLGHGGYGVPDAVALLGAHGLVVGQDFQASTSEVTRYYVHVPAGRADLVPVAVKALRSFASGAKFDAQSVDFERAAVIAENRMGEAYPDFFVEKAVRDRLVNSPCFRASKEAVEASVASAPLESVRRFYTDWYRPDNERLTVTGPIDANALEELVRAEFATIDQAVGARIKADTGKGCAARPNAGNQAIVVSHPQLPWIQLRALLKSRSIESEDALSRTRQSALDGIIAQVFGQRGRLTQRRYLLPYQDFSMLSDSDGIAAAFGIRFDEARATLRAPDDLEPAVRDLIQSLVALRESGVDAGDLKRIKIDLREKTNDAARREALDRISVADVNNELKRLIDLDHNLNITLAAPSDQLGKLPDERQLMAITAAVPRKPLILPSVPDRDLQDVLTATQLAALKEQPFARAPTPRPFGVTTFTLANGIKVLVRPQKEQKPVVGITGFRRGGFGNYSGADIDAASSLGRIVLNSGAGAFDKFDLSDFDRHHSLSIDLGIGETFASIQGKAPATELPALLQRLYFQMAHPRWTEEAFKDWQAQFESEWTTPEARKDRKLADIRDRHFGRFNGRTTSDEASGVSAFSLQNVRNIFEDRFGKAGDFTFVITGDVDLQSALPMINRYLGALSSERSSAPSSEQAPSFSGRESITVKLAGESTATVAIYIPIAMPKDGKARAILRLLRAELQNRVYNRMRYKEGGSYAPSVALSVLGESERVGGTLRLEAMFDCPPDRAGAMKRALVEELETFGRDGMSDAALAAAKAQLAIEEPLPSITNGIPPAGAFPPLSWNDFLVMTSDRDGALDPEYLQKILPHITLREVNEAAKAYIRLDHALELTKLPEK